MSVAYTAVLEVSEGSVLFLSGLLHAERVRRGARKGTRALGTYKQAVLVLRWFLDDTRMSALARDNNIAVSTAYEYRDEGIAVLAARQPSLHGALLAAKAVGHSHVIVDGTLIYTDRISTPGPTSGVDLWWSGKHRHYGGNIQVVSAPDGWPLWTSGVRPGREHDTSAARADPDLLARIADWVSDGAHALADLGYEGEPDTFTIPFKKPKDGQLSVDQQAYNAIHGALRCLSERANSLLKPPTKPSAATAAAPGASATSSPQHWSCSTTNTAAPHDQTEVDHTQRPRLRGMAQCLSRRLFRIAHHDPVAGHAACGGLKPPLEERLRRAKTSISRKAPQKRQILTRLPPSCSRHTLASYLPGGLYQ